MRSRVLTCLIAFAAAAVLAGCGSDDPASDTAEPSESVANSEPSETPEGAEPTEVAEPTEGPEAGEAAAEPTEGPEEGEATAEPTQGPEEGEAASVAASGASCGSGAVAGTTTESFEFEGRTRVFEQLLPSAYDGETALPVVLNWHGLGSTGVEQLAFSGYDRLAEQEGFVVIAPTGVPSPGDTRNSWELTPEQDPTRDDLAFADAVIERVTDTLCVDPDRIYSTGMSNGGYFTSLLVCHRSEVIAAAASVAALTRPNDCDPTRAVPYLGFHGTEDEVVPYAGGGESSLAPGEVIDLFLLEIDAEFAEFAENAGCAAEPVVSVESTNVTSFDYPDCPSGIAMTFYEIAGAGHTWPGSLVSLLISEGAGLGVTTNEIDASAVSWDFFEQYSLDG